MYSRLAALSHWDADPNTKLAMLRLPSAFCVARCCYQPDCLQYPRPYPCPPRWARRFVPSRLMSAMNVSAAVQQLFTAPVKPSALAHTAAYIESLEQLILELVQMSVPFTNRRFKMPRPCYEKARRKEARRRCNLIKKIVKNNRKFLKFVYDMENMPRLERLPYQEHPLFQCAATSTLLKVLADDNERFRRPEPNDTIANDTPECPVQEWMIDF